MSILKTKSRRKSTVELPHHLALARSFLGSDVLFLRCYFGTKKPTLSGWTNLTVDLMDDPVHLKRLCEAGNISVVTGISSGGLISIDVDDDKDVEPFLELNPALRETFRTKGKDGCNFWLRMLGTYPGFSDLQLNGEHWGEFRSHHHHTVIWGRHPDGPSYRWIVRKPALVIPFESLHFPEGIVWAGEKGTGSTRKSRTKDHCHDVEDVEDVADGTDVVVAGGGGCSSSYSPESIVALSTPTGPHQTHKQLFLLARGIKTLELQEGCKFESTRIRTIYELWHSATNPQFLTHSKEDYWMELLSSYADAKFPLGGVSLREAFERAKRNPFPPEVEKVSDDRQKLMIAVCYHLQLAAGEEPFFLPVTKGKKLFGVPERTCWYWLTGFVVLGILQIETRANKAKRRATRFRYIIKQPNECPQGAPITTTATNSGAEHLATAQPGTDAPDGQPGGRARQD